MPNDLPDWTRQFNNQVVGEFQASDFKATGIAPLTACRLVGSVAGGPPPATPSVGTWQTGDLCVDSTFGGTWVWTGAAWIATGRMRLGFVNPTGATSFSFTNIPAGFGSLRLVSKLRHNQAVTVANVGLRFNNDSTSPHYYGDNVFAANANPVFSITADQSQTAFSLLSAGTTNADYAAGELVIPGYAQSDAHHNLVGVAGHFEFLSEVEASWTPLASQAITRIDSVALAGAYLAGSGVWLYGDP